MTIRSEEFRRRMAAGDWDGVVEMTTLLRPPSDGNSLGEYRVELEGFLGAARAAREELGLSLVRVRAAERFVRQSFVISPGS